MVRYAVHDEWPTDDGPRTVAGPFDDRDDALVVLRDVAYPLTFPTGPATVVGDLSIAPLADDQDR